MKNSIDKRAALFLIAGEQNINLVSSSGQTPLTELEKYLQGREEFKEFYRYAWEKLEIRINYLLDEIKKIDSSWYDGLNERDWLHVSDHTRALIHISNYGKIGEKYNIGYNKTEKNIILVKKSAKF